MHESPLGIKDRHKRRHRCVLWGKVQGLKPLRVISSLLKVLRRGPNLIVALRFDVVDLFTTVEPLTNICKVLLHEVDILIVILHIDSWIPDQANSEAMEALSNFPALIYGSFGRVIILSCA